ncbi:hypothetical protein ACL02U_11775 [Streptomyces sp. MS06]|uniref:hypothetical protein n=1 Tax=Streptomyces sp. MS06 TaxID=3385974 RepID=UPI0039A06A37
MPFHVDVWVEDHDNGVFTVYIDEDLITERGARALQKVLSSTINGWRRLDSSTVRAALHAISS